MIRIVISHVCICIGNKAILNFNLTTYTTKAEVLAAVDRIIYRGENTNTTGAFRLARREVFEPSYRERRHAQRLAVLITDGSPTHEVDQLDREVAAVKALGAGVVAFGVTDRVGLILLPSNSFEVEIVSQYVYFVYLGLIFFGFCH